MDSRSRWLVGSSSTSTLGFCSISLQKISRAASPPESASGRLQASSPRKEHLPQQAAEFFGCGVRIELLQPVEIVEPVRECSRGDPARNSPLATSCPHSTLPQSMAKAVSSSAPGAFASSDRSSVVLPAPLRPMMPIFSPRDNARREVPDHRLFAPDLRDPATSSA